MAGDQAESDQVKDSVGTFEAQRPRLFGLAYRLLGSASDAEDVVQDAFVRWSAADYVAAPSAWLTTVVTNLCRNQLASARARRVPLTLLIMAGSPGAARPSYGDRVRAVR